MRPLVRKVLTPEPTPLALPNALPAGATGTEMQMSGPHIDPETGAPTAQSAQEAAWMANAKSMGEAQMQTLKTVGGLVQENPKQAALIVRDWLNNAA